MIMKERTNFNPDLPYRIVEVIDSKIIKYKITQPLKLWIFGLSVRYYDITSWYLRERYGLVKYFENKKEVDDFIDIQNKKQEKPRETIVFDSLR